MKTPATESETDMGGVLNIARVLPRSAVNGPGERFVIWVQGCSLRCRGCWNPDTWSPRPRNLVRVAELAESVLAAAGIEGMTLTGGEPFEQAAPLAPLAASLRATGLSIMVFTGYDLEELTSPAQRALLAQCDVIVAGRYRQEERSIGAAWRGSSNQTVHFLTDRYDRSCLDDGVSCEVHIAANGSVTVTGFPPPLLTEANGMPPLNP
jgi:anaerobic ribonucleoside-triphosphate reductase activating protein